MRCYILFVAEDSITIEFHPLDPKTCLQKQPNPQKLEHIVSTGTGSEHNVPRLCACVGSTHQRPDVSANVV